MRNLSILMCCIFFFSCQKKENTTTSNTISDSVVTKKNEEVKNIEINEQKGDTIFMNFKDEKGFYIAEASIDSTSKVFVKFKNEDIGELNAKILPSTGKGNIRFNQIVFPDKTTDGPFGMDLKTDLKQKGNYILIIGHSQMADNPFSGNFKVQLETIKK